VTPPPRSSGRGQWGRRAQSSPPGAQGAEPAAAAAGGRTPTRRTTGIPGRLRPPLPPPLPPPPPPPRRWTPRPSGWSPSGAARRERRQRGSRSTWIVFWVPRSPWPGRRSPLSWRWLFRSWSCGGPSAGRRPPPRPSWGAVHDPDPDPDLDPESDPAACRSAAGS